MALSLLQTQPRRTSAGAWPRTWPPPTGCSAPTWWLLPVVWRLAWSPPHSYAPILREFSSGNKEDWGVGGGDPPHKMAQVSAILSPWTCSWVLMDVEEAG